MSGNHPSPRKHLQPWLGPDAGGPAAPLCPRGQVASQCSDSSAEHQGMWEQLPDNAVQLCAFMLDNAPEPRCSGLLSCLFLWKPLSKETGRQTNTDQVVPGAGGPMQKQGAKGGLGTFTAQVLSGLAAAATVTPVWGCGEHGQPRGLVPVVPGPLEEPSLKPLSHSLGAAMQSPVLNREMGYWSRQGSSQPSCRFGAWSTMTKEGRMPGYLKLCRQSQETTGRERFRTGKGLNVYFFLVHSTLHPWR